MNCSQKNVAVRKFTSRCQKSIWSQQFGYVCTRSAIASFTQTDELIRMTLIIKCIWDHKLFISADVFETIVWICHFSLILHYNYSTLGIMLNIISKLTCSPFKQKWPFCSLYKCSILNVMFLFSAGHLSVECKRWTLGLCPETRTDGTEDFEGLLLSLHFFLFSPVVSVLKLRLDSHCDSNNMLTESYSSHLPHVPSWNVL